jgi:hypothetical protein
MTSSRTIATRELFYARIGNPVKRAFTICIEEPFFLTEGSVDFAFSEGVSGCSYSFIGLPEEGDTAYGADRIQALEIAIQSVDSHLRRLRRKYEFYFSNDDGPYFEDVG